MAAVVESVCCIKLRRVNLFAIEILFDQLKPAGWIRQVCRARDARDQRE